ncbi:MAG: alpha-L-fucosidase, partial [Planctomycetota bacterium]
MMQEWFKDAKFGIFVSWGIYSTGDTSESWAFFNGDISHHDYMKQATALTATKYDPDAWAQLFVEAGATYALMIAKHHDGFAMWDTALSPLNAKDGAPAQRDLIGPFCDAMRKRNLHLGLYYSHLDWSHPDYASVWPAIAQHRKDAEAVKASSQPFAYPVGRPEDPAAWERFLTFHRGQLKELCTRYSPELLWFDGDWERDEQQWRFKELRPLLHEWSPGVVLNSRMGIYGDYGTPEQSIPIQKPPGVWEFCVTMNDSWGYRKSDANYKTARQCIRMIAECVGMGGNLILDIGPHADGTIPQEQVDILKGIGRWMKKHGEAIYASVAGLPPGHFYGASTMNKQQDTIYLILFDCPRGEIAVKGIRNQIKQASVLGGGAVKHRSLGGAPWANR